MKLNKLSLKDQKLFNRFLGFAPAELAAFSFANIYIWRSLYTIEWFLCGKSLCVFFRDALGSFMYLPPLAKDPDPQAASRAFAQMGRINKNKELSRIENIPLKETEYYRSLGYCVREKFPDYLCLRSDLALLKGNKFKSQRAAYNYFTKHYVGAAAALGPADREDCLVLFDFWARQRKAHCLDPVYCGMLEDNRKVLREALDNYKKLGLRGITVRINRELKAFSFGYPLNKNTFCILYEITDLGVKGLAQFIFRRFSQELKDYRYINIMDDSGLENLRKTKLSYKPARLVPAYIATEK